MHASHGQTKSHSESVDNSPITTRGPSVDRQRRTAMRMATLTPVGRSTRILKRCAVERQLDIVTAATDIATGLTSSRGCWCYPLPQSASKVARTAPRFRRRSGRTLDGVPLCGPQQGWLREQRIGLVGEVAGTTAAPGGGDEDLVVIDESKHDQERVRAGEAGSH